MPSRENIKQKILNNSSTGPVDESMYHNFVSPSKSQHSTSSGNCVMRIDSFTEKIRTNVANESTSEFSRLSSGFNNPIQQTIDFTVHPSAPPEDILPPPPTYSEATSSCSKIPSW